MSFAASQKTENEGPMQAIQKEWATFNQEATTAADPSKLNESLKRILAMQPDDPKAIAWKNAIEAGKGDPSDVVMMIFVIREHIKAGHTIELIRECENRIAFEKRDYYIHFTLSKIMLEKRDLKAAEPHLLAIADPESNPVNMTLGAIAGAIQLLGQLNRDASRLRAFTSTRVIPILKSDRATTAGPDEQFILLYLFAESFRLPKISPEMGGSWPFASRLASLCFDSAKDRGDVAAMSRLALLAPALADALNRMKNIQQITESQRLVYSKEHEERTRKAWTFVLEKQPKTAEAYSGLVLSYARSGMNREAIETLTKGLDVCGDDPQLLQLFSNIATANGQSMRAYERLKTAAENTPKYPRYWFLAANAALKADRRDLAIEALAKGRKALPEDIEMMVMEADVYTGTGHPEKVLRSLSSLREEKIGSMPKACEIFTRALVEIGDAERLDSFLLLTLDVSRKANNPLAAYHAAVGISSADTPTSERDLSMAKFLLPVVEQWRTEFPPLSSLYASAIFRGCESKPGALDTDMARKAILACERAVADDPGNLSATAALVRLRVRADIDANKVLDEIKPLLANIDILTPMQAESLGIVYNANKKYDEAIHVLIPHSTGTTTAGCLIQLAIAYRGQGSAKKAEEALETASRLKMSDRDRADYLATRDLLASPNAKP